MLRFAVYVAVGYLCGMGLSDHIAAELQLTHWTNVWVYFWLILWPFGLIYWLAVWVGAVALLIMGIVAIAVFAGMASDHVRRWARRMRLSRERWWL